MAGSVTKLGDRLSVDFVAARKQKRIVRAFAELVSEAGWQGATIGDIVRRAGVARKTLYDNFEGKDAIAEALVAPVRPDGFDLATETRSLRLLIIELAARWQIGDQAGALAGAEHMLRALRELPGSITPPSDGGQEELNCSLPPGRHGLPRDFVSRNQRHRLLTAVAWSVAERGYNATTVANITKAASVSRRTFYEHFADKEACFLALVSSTSKLEINLGSGFGMLVIEVVSTGVTDEVAATRKAKDAARVIQSLVDNLEVERRTAA